MTQTNNTNANTINAISPRNKKTALFALLLGGALIGGALAATNTATTTSTANTQAAATDSTQMGKGGKGRKGGPGGDQRSVCQSLQEGPVNRSEHGPMDNADLNKDGTVYREELESFMNQGEYRRVTILTYFDRFDTDKDGKLSDEEMKKVTPAHSFNGTDANGDCIVSREEVVAYANEEGRSYRKIGLKEFFNLLDTNNDGKVTPEEIEAAHESGLLARY